MEQQVEVATPRTFDGLPRVAAAVAAAAWGTAVFATVLLVAARPPVDEGLLFFLVDITVACVFGTVAALTLSRRRHPVPWLLAVAGVGGGLAALGYSYGMLLAARPGLPAAEWLVALQGSAWVPGTLALYLVVPWLVRDHPLTAGAWVGLAAGVAITVAVLGARIFANAWAATELFAGAVLVGLAAAGEAEWRHRRGPAGERNGLGWLALGTSILALSFVPLALPWGTLPLPWWTTPAMHLASQAVFPAAVLVAVLRGRMWGLGLAVSRAVLAGVLTGALIGLYLVVTLLLNDLLPGDGAAQLVAAAAVAVAVQPARLWLQTRVHRLVHGAAVDPTHAVRRLGSQLGLEASTEQLLEGLVVEIGAAMRLESVTLLAENTGRVSWGVATTAPSVVPLLHRGEQVGRLEVTVPGGEALGQRGERTLRELAAVLATAVAVAHAAHEVERARERLARARLEERRVIRGEIHDGLGPSLAGLRLGLQGARNLLRTDADAAAAVVGTLQEELDQRVSDVRTLSHHLLPPVLDELGLGAALQELAARYAEDGLHVEVTADGTEGLDPQLAAAAYAIASEALVNVSRHSGAASARVRVALSREELRLTVEDDGRGVPDGARAGVGTASMRERAEEQGGQLRLVSRDGGGTLVVATLPTRVVDRA